TGESEYLVNGAPARLLDVQDIFLGSGVGRTAYSIVEQGRIGQIVSARAEDRRAVVEEAAGVTKYKRRREAAERRMEATEQNLLRVADVVQELGRQLEGLNRQARKAERYKALRARIRELELAVAAARYLELSATRRAAEGRRAELEAEQAGLAARLAELDREAEAGRAALAGAEARLAELAGREHAARSARQVADVGAAAVERELQQIGERSQTQAAELEALKGRAEAATAERAELERQRDDLAALGGADETLLAEAEGQLREVSARRAARLGEVDAARAEAAAAQGRAATHRSQLQQLDRQRADLEARLARSRGEVERTGARSAELDGARSRHVEQLGRTRQLRLRLEEQRGAQEELLERTRSEFIQNEAKLITLREELQDRRARLHSLLDVIRNYEGYSRGVRSLMTRADRGDSQDSGVFGLVADVVSAPPEYETAVEALLGERLQYVIVESHARGIEAIDWLKGAAEGRASLVPLSRLGEPAAARPADVPGAIAACIDLVRFDPAYERLVRWLLGDALVVRDLPAALDVWQRHGGGRTLVTLEGEVLDASGVVTGGPLLGEGHGALQRRREVQELEEMVRAFEAEFALAQERHRTLQARVLQLDAALRALDRDGREKELAVLEQEKDLARVAEELERLATRAGQVEEEQAELEAALAGLDLEEEELRLAAASADADRARAEERAREAARGAGEAGAEVEAATARLVGLKVKIAADGERRESLAAALRRGEAELVELQDRRVRLFAALSEGNARAAELRGRARDAGREAERLEVELAGIREELAAARARCASAAEAERGRDAEARELRRRADAASQAHGEVALEAREQALELAHLEERTRERCQAELRWEVSRFHLAPPPGEAERQLLEELAAQAERMGAIHLTAIEEYDELLQRHQRISAQKTDLEASLADLRAAVARMNRASRERFRETFDRVNEKFQQVFPRLFNGGRAGLALTQDQDGDAEGGVEIFAQPPGKRLQNVNLLSGGEKALTAVALVFAIFLVKPTPFCLLDEVDAPLDDANVGRYVELVREMSRMSQFILITHNRRTMEAVDTLYGVTMEEPGISRLVSARLSGAARPAA
ncbi:MAG TPA: chromosome segregation protein SMC, partial [Anaeromyxobacteraceae bacterium]